MTAAGPPRASAHRRDLVRALRTGLAQHVDPARAQGQQRYMRVSLPFLGWRVPDVRRFTDVACRAHPLASFRSWHDTVLVLFDEALYQEERYAANAVAGHRAYRRYHTARALRLYEHMIVAAAWWDVVDELSSRVGDVLQRDPAGAKPVVRRWSRADDPWLRRASIICQRNLGGRADRGLLFDCIGPSTSSSDFFLRKAIGWALRDLGRYDPEAALAYVRANGRDLSPLSRREALKNLSPQGLRRKIAQGA